MNASVYENLDDSDIDDYYVPGLATNSIFFCFFFVKEIIHSSGKLFSLHSFQLLPHPCLELTQRPSRVSTCLVLAGLELQGHRKVRQCPAKQRDPRTPSRTSDANIDSVVVNLTLFPTVP